LREVGSSGPRQAFRQYNDMYYFGAQDVAMHVSKGKARLPRARAPGSRKVVIEFPKALFERTERAAAELAVDLSSLIRSAVEQYLEALHRKNLDEELAVGYTANADLDRALAAQFSSVDYETF